MVDITMAHLEEAEEELSLLRDRAADIAAEIVAGKLRELERAYPRHKFSMLDGMGSTFLIVDPPVFGEKHLSEVYFPNPGVPESVVPIYMRFRRQCWEIFRVVERVAESFNVDVGDVKSS